MEIKDLIKRFSDTREHQQKAIFSTFFIAGNRIQTVFDKDPANVSLKQFMLLTMIRQSKEQLTFTKAGELLGCSRQNIKKLAEVLMKKGFLTIEQNGRSSYMIPSSKVTAYFDVLEAHNQDCLRALFSIYSDEELQTFFQLTMKMYEAVDELERVMLK